MKILLTGASGFLGNIFFQEWKNEHEVLTLGRAHNSEFNYELTKPFPGLPKFDMVVHAAGKAHVIPKTKIEEQQFFDVNVKGTINLLNALEEHPPGNFVFISSVAVYGIDSGENIDESYPLRAQDPYGKSKIEAENAISEWCHNKGVNLVILRLPLIAGPNPPGNLGAMMNAIRSGFYFRIGNGNAKRSIVNASDVARCIPELHSDSGIFNLVGPKHPSIAEIDSIMAGILNKKIRVMPLILAKILALAGNVIPFFPLNSGRLKKLTTSLTFSGQKSRKIKGWDPKNLVENTLTTLPGTG